MKLSPQEYLARATAPRPSPQEEAAQHCRNAARLADDAHRAADLATAHSANAVIMARQSKEPTAADDIRAAALESMRGYVSATDDESMIAIRAAYNCSMLATNAAELANLDADNPATIASAEQSANAAANAWQDAARALTALHRAYNEG